MAIGWRFCSFLGVQLAFRWAFNGYSSQTYQPLIGAYLRKYDIHAESELFNIRDRKREFYQIDTSQYMNYTHDDLEHGHTNYGPQPDNEVRDASWLTTLDRFLNNEENHGLKEHPRFLNYNYEFKDKSFPSEEQARDLISKH